MVFCLPPLTAVWRVPPAAVLRSEAVPLPTPLSVRVLAPVLLGLGVLWSAHAQGGRWSHAAWFAGGLLVLTGLLWGGARVAMALSARVPRGRLGPTVEHGLAALGRPGQGTTGAVVALGLGVLVVLGMLLVERELSRALREALPEDAPSVFLVDVQRDQWDGVKATLEDEGARSIDAVPVVMARLRSINAETVEELTDRPRGEDGRRRSRWGLTREQRLTWREELPEDNEIVAGELWSEPGIDEVSLEQGYADDLDVTVGDRLTFDVQGIPVELTVTSIRTVDWASFAINFFLVVEPGVLDEAPHMRLAAARLEPPDAEIALQNRIARDFPNVTLLRVRPILEKVAAVLERIALGVRMLGSFTIATGLVILAGAVGATALRRAREAALLKTLGVTRAGVTRLFAVEYALVGLAAGSIGAAGALVLADAFLEHVLQLPGHAPLAAIPLAMLATAALATVSGLAASLRALRVRPMETLRG
jgi:putative ABC transport system permease protein